jgi:acyl-CoA oxidase
MRDFTDKLKPAEPTGPEALAKERSQSTLPVQELAQHLFSDGFLQRQERIVKELQKHKLFSKQNQLNLARPDRYKLGLARAKLTRRIAAKQNWDDEDHHMYATIFNYSNKIKWLTFQGRSIS